MGRSAISQSHLERGRQGAQPRQFRLAPPVQRRADVPLHDADITYGPWGPLRVVYLQYPSDPIVFFETGSLLRRPAIMSPPRPPDVSEGLVWVPVISFLQSVVDMVTAAGTPAGFGHVYAGNDYLDGWLALLEPHGATAAEIARIRERLLQEGL